MSFLVLIDGDWFVSSSTSLFVSELVGEDDVATTTPEAIRDRALTVVEAITPTLGSDVGFRRYRNEGGADFIAWCEANPRGCLRRVQIRTTLASVTPAVSNTDVEEHELTARVLVAYPQDARFGKNQALDRDDAMDSDQFEIDQVIGMNGKANFSSPFADATWIAGVPGDRIEGTGVDFIELVYTYIYKRTR